MYLALYRKYRPQKFSEVIGQNVIIKTLENSIKSDRISHAYLFTGPRGTGKTTVAKIFAKIVNCSNLNGIETCEKCDSCIQYNNKQNIDIIEIDAASNNGVDEIRELREKINLVPNSGKYKVYIVDEVHMLTTSAFNALLKTLEEPPKHIIFILATTEPHKIPLTILSRCQRFDFKKISFDQINKKLKNICLIEKIKIADEALNLITKFSDGCMRDALSLLDKVINYKNDLINEEDVHEIYGSIDMDELFSLAEMIENQNINLIFKKIDIFDENGKDFIKIIELLIDFYKNMLVFDIKSDFFDKNIKNKYEKLYKKVDNEKIYNNIETLLEMIKLSKISSNYRLIFEISMIKLLKNGIKTQKNDKNELKNEQNVQKNEQNSKKNDQIDENVKNLKIDNIGKIKKIRINNALAKFDKKELINFKKGMEKINIEKINTKYTSTLSLIQDGELKVKGDNYLIYVYKVCNLKDLFNSSLKDIEEVLYNLYKIIYKPIAIDVDEWEEIKKKYNSDRKENKNSYVYIEEEDVIDNQNMPKSKKNSLESEFDDIIIYE